MKKNLSECPSCGEELYISQYHCPECGIDINGEFEGCTFCNLTDEDRYFVLVFLQTGGNISDVEKVMGISYPTVKSKLSQLLERLSLSPENGGKHKHNRGQHRKHTAHVFHFGHGDIGEKISEKVQKKVEKAIEKVHAKLGKVLIETGDGEDDSGFERSEGMSSKTPDPELVKKVLDDLKAGKINANEAARRIKGEGNITEESTE